jgi:plasmid stabilization system protein ParE
MHNIRLSDLAIKKLDDLLDYLEEEWSENVAFAFEETFEERINQVLKFPESCIQSNRFYNLYLCVVTKQTSFLYRINNNEVEVITVFDNRSSFASITKEIRRYYGRI